MVKLRWLAARPPRVWNKSCGELRVRFAGRRWERQNGLFYLSGLARLRY